MHVAVVRMAGSATIAHVKAPWESQSCVAATLFVFAILGCGGDPVPFTSKLVPKTGGALWVVVTIDESPQPEGCTVTVAGQPTTSRVLGRIDSSQVETGYVFEAAPTSFPVGHTTVPIEIACTGGRVGHGTVAIERHAQPAELRLGTAPGDSFPCTGTFCGGERIATGRYGTLELTLTAPPNTVVEIAGKRARVPPSNFSLDMAERVQRVDLGSGSSTDGPIRLAIKVTSPDGLEKQGELVLGDPAARSLAWGCSRDRVRFDSVRRM